MNSIPLLFGRAFIISLSASSQEVHSDLVNSPRAMFITPLLGLPHVVSLYILVYEIHDVFDGLLEIHGALEVTFLVRGRATEHTPDMKHELGFIHLGRLALIRFTIRVALNRPLTGSFIRVTCEKPSAHIET